MKNIFNKVTTVAMTLVIIGSLVITDISPTDMAAIIFLVLFCFFMLSEAFKSGSKPVVNPATEPEPKND